MGSHVFISYSQHDKTVAEAICAHLESRGIACWVAPRDIPPGSEWSGAIIDAIEQCDVLVVVFSGRVCNSKHVLREMERADSARKSIIPFRVEPAQPSTSFAYYLGVTQWFDAFPPPVEQHLERFVKVVKKVASQTTVDAQPAAAPPARLRSGGGLRRAPWAGALLGLLFVGWIALLLARGKLKPAGPIANPDDPEEKQRLAEIALNRFAPTAPPALSKPWTNSLGMKFLPVRGTNVLFCMVKTRVQDFQIFVQETAHDATGKMFSMGSDDWKQRGDTWKHPGFAQGPTHPVCGINYHDASQFCQWLTRREQDKGFLLQGQAYRLPTDLEWSQAVGLSGESGLTPSERCAKVLGVYPWGSQWPPPLGAGNYAGSETWDDGNSPPNKYPSIPGYRDNFARTSPAGCFLPNKFGLYDLGGNVWEWTMDEFDPATKDGKKTLRGASWAVSNPTQLLASD